MSAIQAVVFDFGGVVIDAPFAAFEAVEPVPGAVRAVNATNPDANAWAQLERGSIDPDTFESRFEAEAAALGHALSGRAVLQALATSSASRTAARPRMLRLIDELRGRGLRLALLTNNVHPLEEQDGTGWLFDTFDVVGQSCVLGLRKPDPAVYDWVLDRLGTTPATTAMLDDLGINLKPARALGMHTVKVLDAEQGARDLLALLDG